MVLLCHNWKTLPRPSYTYFPISSRIEQSKSSRQPDKGDPPGVRGFSGATPPCSTRNMMDVRSTPYEVQSSLGTQAPDPSLNVGTIQSCLGMHFPCPMNAACRLLVGIRWAVTEAFLLQSTTTRALCAGHLGASTVYRIKTEERNLKGWRDLVPSMCSTKFQDPRHPNCDQGGAEWDGPLTSLRLSAGSQLPSDKAVADSDEPQQWLRAPRALVLGKIQPPTWHT